MCDYYVFLLNSAHETKFFFYDRALTQALSGIRESVMSFFLMLFDSVSVSKGSRRRSLLKAKSFFQIMEIR